MTEFLKGYAAGANDMEAGRLVTTEERDEARAIAQVARSDVHRGGGVMGRRRRPSDADLDRARELAVQPMPLKNDPLLHDLVAARLALIARLLSGDEKCKHCGAEVGNVICGNADRGTMFACSNYSGDE